MIAVGLWGAQLSSEEMAKPSGPRFAEAFLRQPARSWQGPVESGYGSHLVWMDAITPCRVPAFEEAEAEVKTEWVADQRAGTRRPAYQGDEGPLSGRPAGLRRTAGRGRRLGVTPAGAMKSDREGMLAPRRRDHGRPGPDAGTTNPAVTGLISRALVSCLAAVIACAVPARAEEVVKTPQALARQHLNPLAYGVTLPALLSVGVGPGGPAQPTVNFQPIIPFGLIADWRLVSLSSVSIVHDAEPEDVTGLSDLAVSLFLTPARTGTWIWGAGPIAQFPTATNTTLGSSKWSAGPTAAVVYDDGSWVNGILVSHLGSFAGPSNQQAVSLTQIEAQLSYTFPDGWYIQLAPTLSYDWKARSGQGWTVPLGASVGRAFKIGSQGMSAQIGAYYNVKKPSGTAGWVLQTQLSWLY